LNHSPNEQPRKKVYSSKSRKGTSVLAVLANYWTLLVDYRWHLLVSVRSQVKSTYQQDVFGVFWSFLMPIIPMTVYMILAHVKVFNTVKSMPFVFYITSGMLVWLLMAEVIRKVMLSLKQEKTVLVTTDYRAIFAMAMKAGEVVNDTIIRLVFFVCVVLYLGMGVSFLGILCFIFVLMFSFVLAFSIGVVLSVLDVVFQDTRRFVDIFLRYGVFVSSVIFPFSEEGVLGWINNFNVFNTCIVSARSALLLDSIEIIPFIMTLIFGLLLLLFSLKILYVVEYRLRAYI